MATDEILQAIPHRPPFLFVDEVVEQSEDSLTAKKHVDASEAFFEGHYPGNPIMPGVLISEAVFQTGAIFLTRLLAEELENMQRLNLGHNTLITERTVAGIVKGMPNLRSLNLMQARITSSSLDKIAGLRRLENLCVHGTRVSLAAVEALQQKLKNLQVTL